MAPPQLIAALADALEAYASKRPNRGLVFVSATSGYAMHAWLSSRPSDQRGCCVCREATAAMGRHDAVADLNHTIGRGRPEESDVADNELIGSVNDDPDAPSRLLRRDFRLERKHIEKIRLRPVRRQLSADLTRGFLAAVW
jgi:hypothetical protein